VATYRLSLEYDGSAFEGWQVQPGDHRTVQGVLEAALAQVTREEVRVLAAGRTDSGVHAEAQIVALVLEAARDAAALMRALNGVLPADVVVRGCAEVPEGFHPRYAATRKVYRYRIWNGAERSPLRRDRWHWVRAPLDVDALRDAAAALIGPHDFAAFQAAGSDVTSTKRRIDRVEILGEAGGELVIEVEGSGFLRHMVRILVGTLLEVGLGRRSAAEMPEILASGDRRRAGRTAPAAALTLVRVDYDEALRVLERAERGRNST
jgi:tRNA pseudouridine38-40 synthase